MPEKNKIPVSVYQLDLSLFPDEEFRGIVDKIIKKAKTDKKRPIVYEEESLLVEDLKKYNIRIYSAVKQKPPKWKKFLAGRLTLDSKLHNCTNRIYSFISFIGYADHIFAVTGGSGNFSIERYISDDFGLEILVRLFQKDSRVIKIIQDRDVTGVLLGQNKIFRGDQRFSDEDQFGKIYKLVKAELNQKILTKEFGFSKRELTRPVSGCLAKSSFQISKAISFDMLLALVKRFVVILKQKKHFSLNKVEQVTRRNPQNAQLLDELRETLEQYLYDKCKAGENPDVDFCHKDIERYLTASSYIMPLGKEEIDFDGAPDLPIIIAALRKKKMYLEEDIYHFNASVLDRTIITSDDDGTELTAGKVLQHIHGEISLKGSSYFLLDGEWYKILPEFISDLDKQCVEILKESWDDTLIKEAFDKNKNENFFNKKYLGKEGWLVLDTITPDNIECCDLLQFSELSVNLIHVKKGFDNSMRDLASQILISARIIREDIKSDFNYINKVESQTKKCLKSASAEVQKLGKQKFHKDGLKQIFKGKLNKQIVFCLAFVDTAAVDRSLKDNIQAFNSNIAKFSLIELRREIKAMDFDFKIIQLKIN